MLNKTAESIGHSLVDFVDDVGILCQLVMDLDPAQAGHNTAMQAQVRQLQIRVHFWKRVNWSKTRQQKVRFGQLK